MNRSFELRSAKDFHRAFQGCADDFASDDLNSVKAVTSAMFAWHLVDWVFEEYENTTPSGSSQNEMRGALRKFQYHLKGQCPELAYMRAITDGTKHAIVRDYDPKLSGTSKHDGPFDHTFDGTFDTSCLMLNLDDGESVAFMDALKRVRQFWEIYFRARALEASE